MTVGLPLKATLEHGSGFQKLTLNDNAVDSKRMERVTQSRYRAETRRAWYIPLIEYEGRPMFYRKKEYILLYLSCINEVRVLPVVFSVIQISNLNLNRLLTTPPKSFRLINAQPADIKFVTKTVQAGGILSVTHHHRSQRSSNLDKVYIIRTFPIEYIRKPPCRCAYERFQKESHPNPSEPLFKYALANLMIEPKGVESAVLKCAQVSMRPAVLGRLQRGKLKINYPDLPLSKLRYPHSS
ncbi:hypothetical protein CROQUDRAFT_99242 [Cronartium quercuum f. sp. fusiforme G11]|uniref:Uncharacterized protein n=1 Tax=Cronartium quercuum f. sp. fusiforme G11 TaxID=708437 RepID=A0A9P6N827_9BASI|nr:hypothetical protein CROQUDRAFT_99242 [Cronartium quercuum f. sp. fusiforme G11]